MSALEKMESLPTPWLDDLLESVSEAESPTAFFYWAGLTAISAVVRNKVWIQKGGIYRLYPNIYVLFVAKSGLRKGFPVDVAKKLILEVDNTRIISGRNSVQAIIKDLGTAYTRPSGGPPIIEATAAIISGEFSNLLIRDQDALTILTDLYDGHYNQVWRNTLKGTGVEELKNVCITMLGALNQTHFSDFISYKDITGGFLARCVVVLEEKRSRKNALLRASTKTFDPARLGIYLKSLAKLEGKFVLSEEAIQTFEAWYDKFEPEKIEDKTGTANRIHDQVLKVAQLVALSKRPELRIEKEDMDEALLNTLSTMASVDRITLGTGVAKEDVASKSKMVVGDLLGRPDYRCSRKVLLQSHYGDFDSFDLDKIIESLGQAKVVYTIVSGTEAIYVLAPEIVQRYIKLEKEEE